jgi:hypothetical protein
VLGLKTVAAQREDERRADELQLAAFDDHNASKQGV